MVAVADVGLALLGYITRPSSNTIWRGAGNDHVCTKLFYLNKALNGFSCFYDNELPERFFIGHSVGIVLVRARYPEYFAIYQNCTVGRHGDKLPGSGCAPSCSISTRP